MAQVSALNLNGVMGPVRSFVAKDAAAFKLYDASTGVLLATIDSAARTFDLTTLSLALGQYRLKLTRVDKYGNESDDPRTDRITVDVESDGVEQQYTPPTLLAARPLSSGNINLYWRQYEDPNAGAQTAPTSWQIALSSDLATIIKTVTASEAVYSESIGPYSNEQTIEARIRATDGAGDVGPWYHFPVVVADTAAPDVPEIFVSDP